MQDLISTVNYRMKRLESFKSVSNSIENTISDIKNKVAKEETELKVVQDSAVYYKKSQDILYERSVGSLKKLIDSALNFIFYDKNYEIVINLEDKRGTKNLNFNLKDLDNDFEVSLKNGCGNGVRSVVSSILNLFVLVNKGSKYLFLDEKYSYISSEYLSLFMQFLSKLCSSRNMFIVLITHDERFLPFSEKTYKVNDGGIIEELIKGEEEYNSEKAI